MRKPLSLYHPWLYWLRVWQRRLWRHCRWRLGGRRYVRLPSVDERLPYRYIKHTSKLIRRLGDSDLALQRNKVVNLRLAVDCMNGVSIGPGEYFSFCRLVGRPSARRGFVEGMELSFGEARSGIGGGICQLSNLIHWMALHSPLRVVERANHSFDPFPDEGRILPFARARRSSTTSSTWCCTIRRRIPSSCASISPPTNWKANCCAARRALCATTSMRGPSALSATAMRC